MRHYQLFTRENRLFMFMNVLFMPGLVNILIALSLANLLFQKGLPVSFWGQQSLIIDLLMSSFLATLITGLIGYYVTRRGLLKGALTPVRACARPTLLNRFAHMPLRSHLILALLAVLLTALLLSVFVLSHEADAISWLSFVWIKSVQALLISIYASSLATLLALQLDMPKGEESLA